MVVRQTGFCLRAVCPRAISASLRYQLIAKATYLVRHGGLRFAKPRLGRPVLPVGCMPWGHLRLRLRFPKRRYQLIATTTYLAKPRFSRIRSTLLGPTPNSKAPGWANSKPGAASSTTSSP